MQIDQLMNQYEESIFTLAHQVRENLSNALTAFKNDDKTLALDVIEKDEFINNQNELINNQAIQILSLMQPVARDLRLLVGGVKIATDYERIGDYAKNIGRFVIRYYDGVNQYREEVESLGDTLIDYLDQVTNVLKKQDVKEAYRVASLDEEIDQAFKRLLYQIADKGHKTSFPVELTGMLRNLERTGDHLKNICEQVVYIVNGQHVDFG
ncbi:PhoU family transcriptional regulator [Erysipelothrix larvae]|uniref:Phosphate-specific transport system accessory protein PhoU n=1 Tax=Erysipelothrix larvae TaxID=1514105 RepID=A0A0X8H010_9FIRM|nr:phosphate signaling complex protein PhoU [Erysipelothrix larvae]AMC93374.1 PhoU family transcriptional regulator [Erysipelothrix larvae]